MRTLTYLCEKILTVGVIIGLLALFVAYPLPTALLVAAVVIAGAVQKD